MRYDNRDVRVNVRLKSDVVDYLRSLADEMGLPISTLAAIAIGEYVRKRRAEVEYLRDSISSTARSVSSAFDSLMSDSDRLRLLLALVKRLDHESGTPSASSAGPAEPSERESASEGAGGGS